MSVTVMRSSVQRLAPGIRHFGLIAIGVLLLAASYFGAYFLLLRGAAISIRVNDADAGTGIEHASPYYPAIDRLPSSWQSTACEFLKPAHQIDKALRPDLWPADQVVVLECEGANDEAIANPTMMSPSDD